MPTSQHTTEHSASMGLCVFPYAFSMPGKLHTNYAQRTKEKSKKDSAKARPGRRRKKRNQELSCD